MKLRMFYLIKSTFHSSWEKNLKVACPNKTAVCLLFKIDALKQLSKDDNTKEPTPGIPEHQSHSKE